MEESNDILTPSPAPERTVVVSADKPLPRACAWLSFVAAVAAWICLTWQGYAAIAVAAVSFVAGIIALKLHRGALRNLAITALIASVVLLVVVISFVTVLSLVQKAI